MLNKYQKVLNKYTHYSKIYYESIWKGDIQTFRWHRCQNKLVVKLDKENNLQDMIINTSLLRVACIGKI